MILDPIRAIRYEDPIYLEEYPVLPQKTSLIKQLYAGDSIAPYNLVDDIRQIPPPKLARPSPLFCADTHRFEQELNQLNSFGIAEYLLMCLFIESVKMREKNGSAEASIQNQTIKQHQLSNQHLRQDHFKLKDEQVKAAKQAQELEWISHGFVALMVVAGIATFFLSGLPAILAIVQATASVSSGGTKIAQAQASKENQELQGRLIGCRVQRELTQDKIQQAINSLTQSYQGVQENWKLLREILNNLQQTIRS